MRQQLINIGKNYEAIFGEPLESERLEEIDNLLDECESFSDVELLADCEDGTISGGEYEAIRQEIDGKPNHWNISN